MNVLLETILHSNSAARDFLHAYQTMSDDDVADLYQIRTVDVKYLFREMVKRYSVRKRKGEKNEHS